MGEIIEKIKNINNKSKNDIKPIIMNIKDIPQIIEIYKSYWGTNGLYKNQTFENIIKQKISYGYEIKKEIIAFCLMHYKNKDIVNLDLLCVKKEYKGHKYGKNLLSYCINNCKNLNFKSIYLHVSTTNQPALNLYKKLNFNIIKFIEKYYHDEYPKNNDAYYMELKLD